jgi:hypothetical protein
MRRRGLLASLAFAVTLLLVHVATRAVLPSLARSPRVHRLVLGKGVDTLDARSRRGDVAVVGTSLSGGLAAALSARYGGTFVNRARAGSHFGDEVAQSVLARQAGTPRQLVELNPFSWRALEGGVLRYPQWAERLVGPVRPSIVRRALRQLGAEGVLALAAEHFAPQRLRLSGLTAAWRAPALSALAGAPIDREEPPSFPGDVCRLWRELSFAGGDVDVLDDYLAWIDREGVDALIYIPQLKRSGIATDCGADALDHVDRWIAEARAHVEARGHRVVDLSRAVDESLLVDFGHVADENDYGPVAEAWAHELGRTAGR